MTYHMARGKGLFGWGGPNQEPVCSSPHGTIRPSVNVRHLGQALETYWRNTHYTTKPDPLHPPEIRNPEVRNQNL